MSNHGRWRTHAQNDDITWQREIMTCKVKGWDGYMYEPIWINPQDAEARGIKDGDIVKMFNERGTVLGGALVWETDHAGRGLQDHGARADMISSVAPTATSTGAAPTTSSRPLNGISQNCWGMATSGFLVDVQKVTMAEMEEWREKYPEAFAREYDPAVGSALRRLGVWRRERPDEQGLRLRHARSATAATAARSPARTSTAATTGRRTPSRSPTPASSGSSCTSTCAAPCPR